MDKKIDYIGTNKKMWDVSSDIYQQKGFASTLEAVQKDDFSTFDDVEKNIFQELNIVNKAVIQIGCNNGTELITVKKLGAGYCVGIDISEKFIIQARQISKMAGTDIEFHCSDVYQIPYYYLNQFDLVYITVGVLGWMPDLPLFFKIASRLLKVNGSVFIYEQHPMLNMYNPIPPNNIDASYFREEPFEDVMIPEYIDTSGDIKAPSFWFPHKISDILTSCLEASLQLTHFKEYSKDLSFTYKGLEDNPNQLPLSFSMVARK